ncbi:MAG: hypothetical protein M3463_00705 [Verrucomicrobiota bacterium]|nr:hypothetical protein [Verrucomicrobiota bacterium]
MKKTHLLSLSACLVALVLPSTAFAADKAAKREKREGQPRQILKQYDTNANGAIDGDEREALRKAFTGNDKLKSLDTNADGKLDDAEIASIKAGKAGGKAGRKKKNP